jgi:hypothetical protein
MYFWITFCDVFTCTVGGGGSVAVSMSGVTINVVLDNIL